MFKISLTFMLLLCSLKLFAMGEVRYMPRSPYALLMGDAFTARADDNYTLFYNPAALYKNKGIEFYVINAKLGLTNLLSDLDRFSNLSSDPAVLTSQLSGFPIYVSASGVPTLKFGPFGLTLFAALDSSMILRNSVHPILQIDHRYDRGFSFGYSYTIGKGGIFNRNKSANGASTSFGIAVKHFSREGMKKSYDIFGTTLLSDITSGAISDFGSFKTALGYSKGSAWGYDVGVEQSFRSGDSTLSFALAISDINDTSFKLEEGTQPIADQDMLVSSGVSYQFKKSLMDFSLNMDFKPIFASMPMMRKFHFGFDFGIPMVRLMLGFSEGYLSYGAKLKLWPFVITAGFYGVELGHEYRQLKGNRMMIYISLLDFSFDA